jgi:hypothetical protein
LERQIPFACGVIPAYDAAVSESSPGIFCGQSNQSTKGGIMKTRYFATCLALGIVLALAAGCSKSEREKMEGEAREMKAKESELKEKAAEAEAKAREAKEKAEEIKSKTEAAVQAVSGGDTQGMMDKAKSLMDSKQYQPALDTLAKLKDVKLTDTQQKMVDDLKARVQKLMASDALGGLPGK